MVYSKGQISKADGWYVSNNYATCTPIEGKACSQSEFGQCLLAEMDKQKGDLYSTVINAGKTCVGAVTQAISACQRKCLGM